jgi:SAM-dependent methyltransferase
VSLLSRALLLVAPRRSVRAAFTRHYERRGWEDDESVSGHGSTFQRTETIRRALPALFAELGVRSVVDAGCGDFNWFRALGVTLDRYLGIEVVEDLARRNQALYGDERRSFVSLDVIRDPLPKSDLILCRDCLVHLKTQQVVSALRNFRRSGSTYLLATTFAESRPNVDIPLGGWRPIHLEGPPFRLGEPVRRISEAESVEDARFSDKSLGLWRL